MRLIDTPSKNPTLEFGFAEESGSIYIYQERFEYRMAEMIYLNREEQKRLHEFLTQKLSETEES